MLNQLIWLSLKNKDVFLKTKYGLLKTEDVLLTTKDGPSVNRKLLKHTLTNGDPSSVTGAAKGFKTFWR